MELSILGLALVISGCTLYLEKNTKFASIIVLVIGFFILVSQALT